MDASSSGLASSCALSRSSLPRSAAGPPQVLRAAQVNRNFYAAASDVQQLRLELSATHDMQGSTEGQEHNFQRRVRVDPSGRAIDPSG